MNNTEVELEFSIKSYNIDSAGHVNNAVYLNWLEDLRSVLTEKILTRELLINKNLHLVVASTTIDYKRPLYLYEKPIGRMKLIKYEKGILFFSALIILDNTTVVRATQKCVFIDKSSKKMITKNIIE